MPRLPTDSPAVTWYPGPAPRHAVLVVRSSALAPPPATLSAWTNADPGTCRILGYCMYLLLQFQAGSCVWAPVAC